MSAPWVCRSCLSLLRRRTATQFLRKASTDVRGLPPVLLDRARKLAAEHAQLSASLAADFDTKVAKRAGEISPIATALKELDDAKTSLDELEGLLESEDEELQELAREDLDSTSAKFDTLARNLSVALTPKHPFANMPCLIEFRPGPGGMEGRFFTDTLLQMYQKYCARKGYRARLVSLVESDNAGDQTGSEGERPLQEAVLEVQNEGAYDLFRNEAGMHRVQRVPATEAKGRTHTSAVAVWVLPSFPESQGGGQDADFNDPESEFYVNPSDVRSEAMRARGAGGQHVNKTESAIRLTHMPTGIVVSMQDHRSQQRNREDAWQLLRSRIAAQRREEREELARRLKSSVLSKSQQTRGDKIRTYNYQQDRCTDHRSGLDVHNLPGVLEGGETLEKIMDSVREWRVERDLETLVAEEESAAAGSTSSEGAKAGK